MDCVMNESLTEQPENEKTVITHIICAPGHDTSLQSMEIEKTVQEEYLEKKKLIICNNNSESILKPEILAQTDGGINGERNTSKNFIVLRKDPNASDSELPEPNKYSNASSKKGNSKQSKTPTANNIVKQVNCMEIFYITIVYI